MWQAFFVLFVFNKGTIEQEVALQNLKELRHDILSYFFNGLSHSLSVGKPKTTGLLMKEKKNKGVILKQTGTRMAEDGED